MGNIFSDCIFTSTPCGRVFGRPISDFKTTYTFIKELGCGEFAPTALVVHNETKERFACKSINLSGRSTPDVVRHEVEMMHHLTGHPNIVELRDVVEGKDAVHLIMDLCEGGDLSNRIKKRSPAHYDEEAAKNIFRQIAKAVHYCHELGVMHRDLKPENLLFSTRGRDSPIKVIDFGISAFCGPGDSFKMFAGNRRYAAPEQLEQHYGREADIWSAGLILYFLLAGYHPHRAFWKKNASASEDVSKDKFGFDKFPWPHLTEEAKDLVKNMLQPDPKVRISAAEILGHPWVGEGDASDGPMDVTVIERMKEFQAMNKFKRVALKLIAETLPEEEIMGLKFLFKSMDADNNGKITFEELKNGLKKWGGKLLDSEVEVFMQSTDLDGDGIINIIEFVTATMPLQRMEGNHRLEKAFQHFDEDMKGFITMKEMEEAVEQCNMAERRSIEEMIVKFGSNQDAINYDEFVAMMRANN